MSVTPIAEYPIFRSLTQEEVHVLNSNVIETSVKKHKFVYQEGDLTKFIYFVAKGEIKVGKNCDSGREFIRNIIRPNAMFGQISLMSDSYQTGFAQSLTSDTIIYKVPVAVFQSLMQSNFALCQMVIQNIGQQLQIAQKKLTDIVSLDARARIIEFLRDSVASRGHKVGLEYLIKHSLTHQDIANVTCTSRQTVTLVLNELKKANLIYFNRGKILVRDLEALA